jgi:putative copper resistance protein D
MVRRSAGAPSRGLLLAGVLVLAGTVLALAVGVIRHLSTAHGPVLPVSWCRAAPMRVLPALTGWRWVTSWQLDSVAGAALVGLAGPYLAGVVAVSRGRGRGGRWPVWRSVSFLAGLGVCALATCSAVAVYDMAMFSAHMLGHLALLMVAPPLLAAGRPVTLALHAARGRWHPRLRRLVRGRVVGLWFSPPVALAGYTVVIVGTHLTGLMEVIMTRPWAGQVEHLAYLLVGYQFFALVVGDEPIRWRLSMPGKQLLLAVAMAVDTFAGVVLLQATQPIGMAASSPPHLDPLADTHLGGAIMWVGGDAIMAVVMVLVLVGWLRAPDYRKRRRSSWLERARAAALADKTGAGGRSVSRDVDVDAAALEAYNVWLAGLGPREHGPDR